MLCIYTKFFERFVAEYAQQIIRQRHELIALCSVSGYFMAHSEAECKAIFHVTFTKLLPYNMRDSAQ